MAKIYYFRSIRKEVRNVARYRRYRGWRRPRRRRRRRRRRIVRSGYYRRRIGRRM
jgi:hypothetical protein